MPAMAAIRSWCRLHRIGREIGEPDAVRLGLVHPGERPAGIGGVRHAPPRLAILGPAGMIARPAVRIGRAARIADGVADRPPPPADRAEVKPLVEIGLVIPRDLQRHLVAGDAGQADIAAVEGGRDTKRVGHLTLIVRPDLPGNPWNSAAQPAASPPRPDRPPRCRRAPRPARGPPRSPCRRTGA